MPIKIALFMVPYILAGVCNMLLVKSNFLIGLNKPIDNGLLWFDNKPILGKNKTWRGFIGMVVFTTVWMVLLWILIPENMFFIGRFHTLSFLFVMLVGFLTGLGYVIFELPNSIIKRRLNIVPGSNKKGFVGYLFMFIDQADSVVGIIIALYFIAPVNMLQAFIIFIGGTVTHYLVNLGLYFAKLKNQKG